VGEQLAQLRRLYPAAEGRAVGDGTVVVTVPGVPLPAGWNKRIATVAFVVPVGYPAARPDCFWADGDLRLSSGATPQNAAMNTIPGFGELRLWFSWHLAAWSPSRDSLLTYVRTTQRRFAEPR